MKLIVTVTVDFSVTGQHLLNSTNIYTKKAIRINISNYIFENVNDSVRREALHNVSI
jgi:hypothetical protein